MSKKPELETNYANSPMQGYRDIQMSKEGGVKVNQDEEVKRILKEFDFMVDEHGKPVVHNPT